MRQWMVSSPLVSVRPSRFPPASVTLAPAITAPALSTTVTVIATGLWAQAIPAAKKQRGAKARLQLRRSTPDITFHPHHGIGFTFMAIMQRLHQICDGLRVFFPVLRDP